MNAVNTSPEYWSCLRKRRYMRLEAFSVCAEIFARRGVRVRPYRCDYGHHWHITHAVRRAA